jgi:hypothetical protein
MPATAAQLSRAVAATFDVLLSGLALEVQPRSLLLVTLYPLPASARGAANGFWQIVSIKEQNNSMATHIPGGLLYCSRLCHAE